MIRITLIMVFIAITFFKTYSNTLDSLIALLPGLNATEQTDISNQLGVLYSNNRNFEQAIVYFHQALALSVETGNTDERLKATKELSRNYFYLKNIDKSLEYALKLEQFAKENNNELYLGDAYNYLARIKGQIMNDLSSSRDYTIKAIELYKKNNFTPGLLSSYNDLAVIYMLEEKYLDAVVFYKKGIEIAEKVEDLENIRLLKSNIAGAYLLLKEHSLAYQYNKEALDIPSEAHHPEMLVYDYLLLAMMQTESGQIVKAIENGIAGSNLADSLKSYDNLGWAYEVLLNAYKLHGDFKNATLIAEKTIALQANINKTENALRLAEKETEIKLLLKDQELLKLEKAKERQTLIQNVIIVLTIVSLILAILLYNRKRLIVKLQKKELGHLNFLNQMEEKEKKILQEKLSFNEKALASKTMHIIQKNEILSELKISISSLINDSTIVNPQVDKINSAIDNRINFDEDWTKFKLHFDAVHPDFFGNLNQRYPTLNSNDIRFCAYIKMGLSTKEIAQMMGISPTSIQKARYRLKKKMDLEKSTDLISFINLNI